MTTTISPTTEAEQDADEITWLITSAQAALTADPTGWLDQIDWTEVTEAGDTWRECPACGIPFGECCAWCGCDCEPVEDAPVHETCVGLDYLADFLREYATA